MIENSIAFNTFYQSPLIYCNMPNLQVADEGAFSETQLRELTFPELTTIGNFAFYQMPYLYSISMPELGSISYSAFQNCFQLRFGDFPSVKAVEVNAFSECLFLKRINLPNAIAFNNTQNDSMYGTFNQCQNLTEIDLPSATSLKGLCFKKCQYLEKVNLPNAVYIGNNTFYLCDSLSNIILEKAEYIDERAFFMANLSGDVSLHAVKEIANEAFCSTNITSLSLPNLEILGENAFADLLFSHTVNNKLKYLYVPNLKIAKDYAFAYLTALTTLDLPSLVEIGTNAFIGSGVSRAEFSNLETAKSLPVVENSIIALPSTFKECTEDTQTRNYKIYGTKGTYAEEWALANGHEFFEISQEKALLEDLPLEYTGNGEVLSPDVIGFNKTYQWYSNSTPDNTTGTPIDGATDKEFNPADYPQSKYYYCIVTSTDVGYDPITITTGVCENTLYVESEKSCITNVTYEPSREYKNTFTATAVGRPMKIQFIEPYGGTRTYDRNHKNVTIKSYDENGNEVSSLDRTLSYEVWEICSNMAVGVEIKTKAKCFNGTSTEWEDMTYNFTVEFLPLDTSIRSITPAATSGPLGGIETKVVTGPDVQGIRFVMPNETTCTYYSSGAAVLDNGDLEFTGKIWIGDLGLNVIKVLVRSENKWTEVDTIEYMAE